MSASPAHPLIRKNPLPVEIVLHPSWWFHHEGISFDEDFFYHPVKRVESERRMERALYERWGRFGLGTDRERELPVVGAVHQAAGYLLSEMLGCPVEYREDSAPQVLCAHHDSLELDPAAAFHSAAYRRLEALQEQLRTRCGGLTGDINWSGILNIALDLRGEGLFTDLYDRPEETARGFASIARVIEEFTGRIQAETGTSSISVNRTVLHLERPLFLHSECSLTMVSTGDYERFLMPFDVQWSRTHRPFGIHYCGRDPHRYAEVFARIPNLDFLDVGWGGDVQELRRHLPRTFLNLRLSPVEILDWTPEQIRAAVSRLVRESADPWLTGVCCINLDHQVGDEQVAAIFEAVEELRREAGGMPGP